MTRQRRIFCYSLATVFGIACFWWLFYMPHGSRTVLRAILPNASFVSVHDKAAGRWQEIVRNPVADSLLDFTEVPADVLNQLSNPEVTKWLDRLAGERFAVAHVRNLNYVRADAILFSSWIGNYSWLVRWGASLGLIPQLDRKGSHAKRPIWTVKGAPVFGGRRISVAVADGVLMCCISRDPEGVRFMVECFDRTLMGRSRSARPTESILDMDDEYHISGLWSSDELDKGWVRELKAISSLSHDVVISCLVSNRVTGSIEGDYSLPSATALTETGLGSLGRVLGDLPEILAILPSQYIERYETFREQVGMPKSPEWWHILADAVRKNGSAKEQKHIFVCMMGGEYRGRMRSIYSADHDARLRERGLAVPSFMVGVQIGDSDVAGKLSSGCVDAINRQYGTGLIERRIPVGDLAVIVLEGTVKSWYSTFLLEERFAYAFVGDWLVIGSNSESLMKLVARYQRDEATAQAASSRWLHRLEEAFTATEGGPGPNTFLWTDFTASSATMRDGLAVWIMKLVGNPRTSRTRAKLKVAQKMISALEHLESVRAWIVSTDSGTQLHFSVGQ